MGEEATCLIGGLRSRTPTRLRAELFHTAGCLFDEGGNGTGIGDVDCVTARHVGDGGAGPFRHELLCRIRNHLVVADLKIPAWLGLPRRLCDRAAKSVNQVPLFAFQEGHDESVAQIFRTIANITGGAYSKFDAGSAQRLVDLLRAVVAYAVGGRDALIAQNSEAARLLLTQVRK